MSAPHPVSPARLAANRANAQCSTGPRTESGKAVASLNAVKTGLTGRTVLLPTEDAQAYEDHILKFVEFFQPVGEMEILLVQSMADTQWRLDRIPALESATYALGRLKYADHFPADMDKQTRAMLLDSHILEADAKKLKNLHLQESRLRRYYRQDLAELQACQKERKDREEAAGKEKTAAAQTVGFEFTIPAKPFQTTPAKPHFGLETMSMAAEVSKHAVSSEGK